MEFRLKPVSKKPKQVHPGRWRPGKSPHKKKSDPFDFEGEFFVDLPNSKDVSEGKRLWK